MVTPESEYWLLTWMATACSALACGLGAMLTKARQVNESVLDSPAGGLGSG